MWTQRCIGHFPTQGWDSLRPAGQTEPQLYDRVEKKRMRREGEVGEENELNARQAAVIFYIALRILVSCKPSEMKRYSHFTEEEIEAEAGYRA